ncbi:hypothetical protein [Pseudodesulfovibrio sp.]|uniref:hypothetical protein n=1 Tax=unclassified Pseudodesulfovibrio TaxID=2661612 RepID=UPI003B006CAF
MGTVLQVRVMAETYSEDEVKKAWPALWDLVWEDGGDAIPKKGVLELVQAVYNAVRAGLVSSDKADALSDGAEAAEDLRFKLQDALAARNPQEADRLSYAIEDALDELEDTAKKF